MEKEVWQSETLKILAYIDEVLTSKGLWYSLAYGSLLGAVRENGFIPWDRDADIIIKLPERDLVRKVLKENLPAGMIYIDSSVDNSFCYDNIASTKYYDVFVDVFALYGAPEIDKLTDKEIAKILKRNKFCVKVFGAKYGKIHLLTNKNKVVPYLIVKVIMHFIPNGFIRKLIRRIEFKINYDEAKYCMTMATYRRSKDIMPKELFDKTIRHKFCDIELNILVEHHAYLTRSYGEDYMIPKQTGWQ